MTRLVLDRDWTWDGLAHDGIVVKRDGKIVGAFSLTRNGGTEAFSKPERGQTDLVFFDAIDPKPQPGAFPAELHPQYRIDASFEGMPAHDAELQLNIDLPITSPPSQRPQLASAGIAMSPYVRSADYSLTESRRRGLWLEFHRPPDDPNDQYFARVLRNAPDPLLSNLGDDVTPIAEPPLAVDPEWIRVIVQGQSDDRAGLDAMQELIGSDSSLHFMLPLPNGMDAEASDLFGFFTCELRVGHASVWSTTQGRFGPPLRVTGIQYPPPALSCAVIRDSTGVTVSAPFALPVLDGRSVQTIPPRSQLWVLLYAQAEQVDGTDRRNVLLAHRRAFWERKTFDQSSRFNAFGTATFSAAEIRSALESLAFVDGAPLSVLAVELLSNGRAVSDPLGNDLGVQRILRTSPLTPVPHIC